MMWRSRETLLLFVAVGRKRLLMKRQDGLGEVLQNLWCIPLKEIDHEKGGCSLLLRISLDLKVVVDKYLWGIFTHNTKHVCVSTSPDTIPLFSINEQKNLVPYASSYFSPHYFQLCWLQFLTFIPIFVWWLWYKHGFANMESVFSIPYFYFRTIKEVVFDGKIAFYLISTTIIST